MRLRWVVIVSLLIGGGALADAEPTGKVCVERGEAEGPIKKHPVRILGTLDGKERKIAELRGTKKVCAAVPAGQWSLEARSTSPFDKKAKDPDACRSAPLLIEIPKGQTVTVWVSPVGRNGVYHCGWELN
jgi:hypothetical protein